MEYLLIIPILALLLFAAYLLILRGRRRHPGWKALEGHVYAHRGLHGNGVPENSMEAFRLAVEKGYGIELDVHLLSDGELAVIHDAKLMRTTGAEGNIEDLTLAQLKEYHLEGTRETIPSFRQVLELVNGRVPLVVELKPVGDNFPQLTEKACRALADYPGAYCIESFDPRCIHYLKKHHPHIIRGQLAENFLKTKVPVAWAQRFCMTWQLANFLTLPDFAAYRFQHRRNIGVWLVKHIWGLRMVGWTIKTPEELQQAQKEGWIAIFEGFEP